MSKIEDHEATEERAYPIDTDASASDSFRGSLAHLLDEIATWKNEELTRLDRELQQSAVEIAEAVAQSETELETYIAAEAELSGLYASETPMNGAQEERLAVFRRKLFTSELRTLSPEQVSNAQSKVIQIDTALEEFFQNTIFGTNAAQIEDPNELLSRAEVLSIVQIDRQLHSGGEGSTDHDKHFDISKTDGSNLQKLIGARISSVLGGEPHGDHEEAIVNGEILHHQAVAQLVLDASKSKLLTAIASIHDCFKHTPATTSQEQLRTEIALHEIGSAILGKAIADAIIVALEQQYPELNSSFGSGFKKLTYKLIATHGFGEFPHVQSKKNPIYSQGTLASYTPDQTGCYNLDFSDLQARSMHNRFARSIYRVMPSPKTIAICDARVGRFLATLIRNMALVLNAADQLVGGKLESFNKYNLMIPSAVVSSYPSVREYVQERVFASILDCVSNESLDQLQGQQYTVLHEKVATIKQKAAFFYFIFETAKPENVNSSEASPGFTIPYAKHLAKTMEEQLCELRTAYDTPETRDPNILMQFRTDFDIAFNDLVVLLSKIDLEAELSRDPTLKMRLEQIWSEIENYHSPKKQQAARDSSTASPQ